MDRRDMASTEREPERKPLLKLLGRKKAMVLIAAGAGAVSYRTYQSYQQKGHLDSVDFWVAAIATAVVVSIVAVLGWWANRPE